MDATPIVIINPHLEPAAVEERKLRERNEDHARDNHVQHSVRVALRELAPKILELKKLRDQPGQPGWAGSRSGLDLCQLKGLATILCVSRSRHKSKTHLQCLPDVIHLPPAPEKEYGTIHHVRDVVELKRLVDAQVAMRFPKKGEGEAPAAEPGAPKKATEGAAA